MSDSRMFPKTKEEKQTDAKIEPPKNTLENTVPNTKPTPGGLFDKLYQNEFGGENQKDPAEILNQHQNPTAKL